MRFQALKASLIFDVPNSKRFVVGTADYVVSARMPADATYPVIVTDQCEQAHAHRHVPDLDRAISRAADQKRTGSIGRTTARMMVVAVQCQTALLQRLRIAVRDRLTDRAQCGIGRPGNALHRMIMLFHDDLRFVGGQNVFVRIHRPHDDCKIT